ncbi:hypothetical protein Hanom_Chr11g01012941 [Helianthus anomalus]
MRTRICALQSVSVNVLFLLVITEDSQRVSNVLFCCGLEAFEHLKYLCVAYPFQTFVCAFFTSKPAWYPYALYIAISSSNVSYDFPRTGWNSLSTIGVQYLVPCGVWVTK